MINPQIFEHLQSLFSRGSYYNMKPEATLANAIFVDVDGAFNFRSVGGYTSNASPNAVIRQGLIYRTGHLSNVSSAGWRTVKGLGVSTVIDLTCPGEVEIFTGAPDKTLSPMGIETLHLPFKKGVFSMARQVEKYQEYRTSGPEASTSCLVPRTGQELTYHRPSQKDTSIY
jgi:hypothetical protein